MKKIISIIFLVILIFLIWYSNNSQALSKGGIDGKRLVTKVIDGDTFLVDSGATIRMLGIDTDEKEHPCYNTARIKLEQLILNKIVLLKSDKQKKDVYNRYLAYVFLDEENINEKMLSEGFAVARFQDPIQYQVEFTKAEQIARNNKIGCKWQNVGSSYNTGSDSTPACSASNFIGSDIKIKGIVTSVYKSAKVNFLNVNKDCLALVIFPSDLSEFGKIDSFKNKNITVSGLIKEYNGKPEIILKDKSQISVS